jgi:hypothetical protein
MLFSTSGTATHEAATKNGAGSVTGIPSLWVYYCCKERAGCTNVYLVPCRSHVASSNKESIHNLHSGLLERSAGSSEPTLGWRRLAGKYRRHLVTL